MMWLIANGMVPKDLQLVTKPIRREDDVRLGSEVGETEAVSDYLAGPVTGPVTGRAGRRAGWRFSGRRQRGGSRGGSR
jgi:hypothetical protein